MKYLLFTLSFLVCTFHAPCQDWAWSRHTTTICTRLSDPLTGANIATDRWGNVFQGITASGASSVSYFPFVTSSWNILSKFDSAGNRLWSRDMYADEITDIATDNDGNVIIAGHFGWTARFDTFTLRNPYSSSGALNFLVKYDSAGHVVWAKQSGNCNNVIPVRISVDNLSNIYLISNFNSDTLIVGHDTLTTGGFSAIRIYLTKYSQFGSVLWSTSFGPMGRRGYTNTSRITSDEANNVYFTGVFRDSITLGRHTLYMNNGYGFVAKADSNGNVIWASNLGGKPQDVKVRKGELCVAGNVRMDTAFFSGLFYLRHHVGGGASNYFLARYDTAGHIRWVRGGGGDNRSYARTDGQNITFDQYGNTWMTGFMDSVIFIDSSYLTAPDSSYFPAYLIAYNPSGNLISKTSLRGGAPTSNGVSWYPSAGLATGLNGDIYISSSYLNCRMFIGLDTFSTMLYDFYIAKFHSALPNKIHDIKLPECVTYPNPASSVINIRFSNRVTGLLTVIDLSGRQVLSSPLQNELLTSIECFGWTPGTYLVYIKTNEGLICKKIIVSG